MLHVEREPKLQDPLLVIACTGWVDAGQAGEHAVAALVEQLEGARRFATLDLAELVDLQQTRPRVELGDGGIRTVTWPELEWVAGRAGRDVVVLRGPEPSLRWPAVARDLTDLAGRLGVTAAATLGGIPALVSHRRSPRVLASAVSRSLAQEMAPLRPDYVGPTGFQTVLQHRLGAAGVAAVGLWAEVPQYVAGAPCPPAVRALLGRLGEYGRLDLDLSPLDAVTDAWIAKVEEGLAERPDVARLVEQLEEDLAAGDDVEAGGAELVSEIERFLRDERD